MMITRLMNDGLRFVTGSLLAVALLGATTVTLTGCSANEGAFEDAGEEIDDAIDEVEDEVN